MSEPSPASRETTPQRSLTQNSINREANFSLDSTLAPPSPAVPLPLPLGAPERIGRYRLLRLLGQGGMGAVYLADDTQMGREVALKVPRVSADSDPSYLERFYREARTAARLQHPNICPVFDVDEADGYHYLTMAYIEGQTLSQLVPSFTGRHPRDASVLVRTIALALDEAHRKGVIHRDLKPSNIMINQRGEPVVMDFGLAREIRSGPSDLSLPGMIMGTPSYMAPEQARGDMAALSPASDIYSLGVILYQLLVGRLPFEGTTVEVLAKHLEVEPPQPSRLRSGLDPSIEAICLKAMAKDRTQRFLCMPEFAQELDAYIHGLRLSIESPLAAPADEFEQAVARMLLQLRTLGWRDGLDRIKESAPTETDDPRRALLIHWLGGDEAIEAEARAALADQRQYPALVGWVLVGRAYLHNRRHDFDTVPPLLRRAEAEGDKRDNILQAVIAQQWGFCHYYQGKLDAALDRLHASLDLCGREHHLTGWVLDLLGLVYAAKNNFHAAREFFRLALENKRQFGDERGLPRIVGHLGMIALDWDDLDRAEEDFQQALLLAQRVGDTTAQGTVYNYLGQVALQRGMRETESGRRSAAKRWLNEAGELLEASIRSHGAEHRARHEGFSHKDRARLALAEGDLDGAERHTRRAEELFEQEQFAEGLAHVRRVWGVLQRLRGQHTESLRRLRQSLSYFEKSAESAEVALTQLEIARTMVAAGEVRQLSTRALLETLRTAETCRRPALIRKIEAELKAHDEEAHWRHVFHRVRGRDACIATESLEEGENEAASVLVLNLQGFMSFCQGLDAADVMRTLNQMMADLAEVLEAHKGFVTCYLGGGFMALFRGAGHAARGIEAALDLLKVVETFNRPRVVLGLRQLPVRISIASGSMFLGNIGTYYKMDFTAVGLPANLASRLQRQANTKTPCISQETYDQVRNRFEFAADNPRVVEMPGIGRREVWDVVGRKKEASPP